MLRIYLPIYIPFLWSCFRWFSSTFWQPKEHSSLPRAFQRPQPLPWQSAFAAPDSLAWKCMTSSTPIRLGETPWLSALQRIKPSNFTPRISVGKYFSMIAEIWRFTLFDPTCNPKKCEMLLRNLFMFSPSETRNTFIRITGLSAMSSMFGKKRNAYIYEYIL